MNIELRSLRHVTVLAELLSYTKAAQELCLTQSALTRSIQSIEKRVQARLFDRDRGGVRLTPVGRAFVQRAIQLLRDADDLEKVLQQTAGAAAGEVSFGMGPLAAQALLPPVISNTLQTRPELRTHIMVRNVAALLPALIKEEIEFVVCPEDPVPESAPVKSVFLGWFPISFLVRRGHPLLEKPERSEHDKYPLLSPGQFHNVERWPPYCRSYLSGPVHLIEDYSVAARLTESTDAIWLCSTFAASEAIHAGTLQEISPPPGQRGLRFRMMLYSLDRRSLSPAATLLNDKFRERIRELEARNR